MNTSYGGRVGVVTVAYRSAEYLPKFLECVASQRDVAIALYLVDNDSPDDSVPIAQSANLGSAEMHLIRNGANLGVAAGNNVGIRAAIADGVDWVLLLNNDTEFGADFIASLLRVATAGGCDLLAPKIVADAWGGTLWYGGGRMVPWQGYRVVHYGMYKVRADDWTIPADGKITGYASTCCLLISPRVFSVVGLMDESYFVYSDDADFSIRCTRAGIPTYVTGAAELLHKDGGSTGGNLSPFSVWWLTRNWALLARRYLSRWQVPLALAYMLAWVGARRILGRDQASHLRLRIKALRAGFRADKDNHEVPADLSVPSAGRPAAA